jgi:sodium pump decarboxylase gamma subunit
MIVAQPDVRRLLRSSLEALFHDEGLPLAIVGMLVVFLALSLIVAFISVLPRAVRWLEALSPRKPATATVLRDDTLDDETLAVIAAAVSETMGHPHRIIKIRGTTSEEFGWSLEGRMKQHQSHKLPH